MMRLDKYLSASGQDSRSRARELIRGGRVTVDGRIVRKPEEKLDETTALVCVDGAARRYEAFRYYMLCKPPGVVSAVRDREKTVLDLLPEPLRKDLFPVGRLDRDTTGLLLLTNDGALAHALLSPARHVEKTYLVRTREPLPEAALRQLEQGVDIGEKRPTLPAKTAPGGQPDTILLTIREGKYHQVKRMLRAVGYPVAGLKRISMGTLRLDETLPEGGFRPLRAEEVEQLKQALPAGKPEAGERENDCD